MEVDTVLLKIVDFNELRDFYNEIKKKNTHYIYSYGLNYGNRFISTEDAVKEITAINDKLHDKIVELEDKIRKADKYSGVKSFWKRLWDAL